MCLSLRVIIVVTIDYNVIEPSNNIRFCFVFNQKRDQASMHIKLQ